MSILCLTDAAHGSDSVTRRGCSGVVTSVQGPNTLSTVGWLCQGQHVASGSAAEAEIVALSLGTRTLGIPLQRMFGLAGSFPHKQGFPQLLVFTDSETSVKTIKNGTSLALAHLGRHQAIRLSFLMDLFRDPAITLQWMPRKDNVADLFTHFEQPVSHSHHTALLGMMPQ